MKIMKIIITMKFIYSGLDDNPTYPNTVYVNIEMSTLKYFNS